MDGEATDRRGLFRSLFVGAGRVAAEGSSMLESLETLASGDPDPAAPLGPTRRPLARRTATLDELAELASDLGLESRWGEIRGLARESVAFAPGGSGTGGTIVLGGSPRLPAGFSWPEHDGVALELIAAADAGALAGAAALPPSARRLLFFFDDGARAGAVLALPDGEALEWTEPGERAGAAVELVLPRVWSRPVEVLGLSEPERLEWGEVRRQLAEAQGTEVPSEEPHGEITHRLLGYADAPDSEEQTDRWELLAQFSPDDELGWSWGDPGERLYFFIDRDALAAGDMTAIWTVVR